MLEDAIRGEVVEKELEALITRRALKTNPEQRRIEDGWAESRRRHDARHREAVLRQRLAYHQQLLESHTATFEALLRRHRVGLRACEDALERTTTEGDSAA